jgi:hypothetical protein
MVARVLRCARLPAVCFEFRERAARPMGCGRGGSRAEMFTTARDKVIGMSSIEVDATDASWRKATRSVANGACVEVAPAADAIMVRDSVDRSGPTVSYSASAWQVFITTTKDGAYSISG